MHRNLLDGGLIEPLALGGPDEAAWLDLELASLAENRIGETQRAESLDPATRETWLRRATVEPLYRPSDRDLDRCYWLLDRGERVGTVALATDLLGTDSIRLTSLYVVPTCRGRGVARRVLAATRDAAVEIGVGMRLTTSWAWQRTLRLYLSLGMWVRAWRQEIELFWRAGEPAPLLSVNELEMGLGVLARGERIELARARRSGDALLLRVFAGVSPEASNVAVSTLSVHAALHGWPLVRSASHWPTHYLADAGAPEALAYRIMVWEAWDREHGFKVETPRIHALRYPTWEELSRVLEG